MDNAEKKWESFDDWYSWRSEMSFSEVSKESREAYQQSLKELIEAERADAREELYGATGSHEIAEIESKIITLRKVLTLIDKCEPNNQTKKA